MNKIYLRPCPFCGEKPILQARYETVGISKGIIKATSTIYCRMCRYKKTIKGQQKISDEKERKQTSEEYKIVLKNKLAEWWNERVAD